MELDDPLAARRCCTTLSHWILPARRAARKEFPAPLAWLPMSKKTKKKKAKMRRSKANHGKRPNMGR